MTVVNVKLTREQFKALTGSSSEELGNVSEKIARQVFEQFRGVKEVIALKELEEQTKLGDLVVITEDNKDLYVEVKTAKEYKSKDRQAIDIQYVRVNNGSIRPYVQSTTGDDLGWLFRDTQTDYLVCFSPQTWQLYIIKNWQVVKQRLEHIVRKHTDSKKDLRTLYWSAVSHETINKHLTLAVAKDKCKETIFVSLELTEEALRRLRADYTIFNLDIETEFLLPWE